MNENQSVSSRRSYRISFDLIKHALYGRVACLPLDLHRTRGGTDESAALWIDDNPLSSLQQLVRSKETPLINSSHAHSLPQTLPRQVGLCRSGVPGPHDRIGVYAKTRFDVGTWIGPYEGKRLSLQDGAHFHADGRNRWEIYDGSTVIGFVDSDDERTANWMRYVQTARYEREQNLEVVQRANGDIFYRATKPIEAGTELLVWYGSGYHCHFDLPCGLNSERGQDGISDRRQTTTKNPQRSWQDNRQSMSPPVSESHQTGERDCGSGGARTPTVVATTKTTVPSTITTECEAWQCGQCFRTFSQRVLLQMHVCDRQPDKPFRCGYCRLSFKSPDELKSHVQTHTDDKPFRCGFCHRAFAGATTLNNHIRTHTNIKPFACVRCGKEFTQGTQYSRHLRLHECVRRRAGDRDNRSCADDHDDDDDCGGGGGDGGENHGDKNCHEDETINRTLAVAGGSAPGHSGDASYEDNSDRATRYDASVSARPSRIVDDDSQSVRPSR